jgi:hypothetical protein
MPAATKGAMLRTGIDPCRRPDGHLQGSNKHPQLASSPSVCHVKYWVHSVANTVWTDGAAAATDRPPRATSAVTVSIRCQVLWDIWARQGAAGRVGWMGRGERGHVSEHGREGRRLPYCQLACWGGSGATGCSQLPLHRFLPKRIAPCETAQPAASECKQCRSAGCNLSD